MNVESLDHCRLTFSTCFASEERLTYSVEQLMLISTLSPNLGVHVSFLPQNLVMGNV